MLNLSLQIAHDLGTVSDLELKRAEIGLESAMRGGQLLGVVDNEDTRKLWALGRRYMAKAMDLARRSEFDADTADERADLARESARQALISHLCHEMFWAEAKAELGGLDKEAEYGISQGWELRARKHVNALKSLIGPLNLSGE